MRYRILFALFTIALTLTGTVLAESEADTVEAVPSQTDFPTRRRLAAVDARFAATWIAGSYDVPARVAQEMLYKEYSYAETLIALAFMGEGLSLNEVLEQRRLQGGARWKEIASTLGLDTSKLPKPIAELLWFGRNQVKPPVIHFLPDPYPGVKKELVIPPFEPTVPGNSERERFHLSDTEVKNIRYVLDDPLGVPEEDLLLPAGRGLTTADWVLSGAIAYFKPFPMDSLLAARVGEDIPWSEVSMAFGFRPDVLTQGPLSGIYPVLSGYAPDTVLIARKRIKHPKTLPLLYDLERITPGEKRALQPLLYHYYDATDEEIAMLTTEKFDMAEKGLALVLARMSTLDLSIIIQDYRRLGKWTEIVRKYAIDLTGNDDILEVMVARDELK